jgi:hypothetical protein
MLLAPGFPDRAFLIVIVFSGITLGGILTQCDIKLPAVARRNPVLFTGFLLLLVSFSFLDASRNIVGIYLKWQNRIEYITVEKAKENLDVEVKAPIPATNKHAAAYGLDDVIDDETDWPNTSIAHYFGLKSIKRLDSNEPWESTLW